MLTPEGLQQLLPAFAAALINGAVPDNENFIVNPDDPAEHDLRWHEFGIITHSRKSCGYYARVLKEWDSVRNALMQEIDGKPKSDLLEFSLPIHDLGKFARDFKMKNGKREPDYKGHEAKSEYIIRNNHVVYGALRQCGFSHQHIEYIARCTGLHYELGKIRSAARNTDLGYTEEYVDSTPCAETCRNIAADYSDFKTEIGILFFCDSMAKTDIRILPGYSRACIAKEIRDRDLPPELIDAVIQLPVNQVLANRYIDLL